MTNNVHSQSMTVSRSVDDVYILAEQSGFALLDKAIDDSRLRAMLGDDRCGALVVF